MPRNRGRRNKKVKPVLHIFCEGEKTEPNYINGYLRKEYSDNRLLKVIKVEKTNKNTPIQLVEEAIKLKNNKETTADDCFWVVYDREAKSKYSDTLHKRALIQANDNGIEVSLTNVCFEVWIILHFCDLTAAYTNFRDLMQNSTLKESLRTLGVEYSKADEKLFDLISDSIPEARIRAERMNASTLASSYHTEADPHLLNPYTRVHKLLDAIDKFVKKPN